MGPLILVILANVAYSYDRKIIFSNYFFRKNVVWSTFENSINQSTLQPF